MECDCWFCSQGRQHPAGKYHESFHAITHRLLVAESLDPAHSVPLEACETCGHKRRSGDDK